MSSVICQEGMLQKHTTKAFPVGSRFKGVIVGFFVVVVLVFVLFAFFFFLKTYIG